MKLSPCNRTMLIVRQGLLLSILFFLTKTSFAQTNAGKDFWVVQTPNIKTPRTDTARFAIGVANLGTTPSTVTITNPVKATQTATIAPGSLQMFFFATENPNIIPSNSSNVVYTNKYQNNVYHVTSNQNVITYSFTPFSNVISNDAALVLPTQGLGKRYRVISYINAMGGSFNSYFGVVASQDATTVRSYDKTGTLRDVATINTGEYFQRLNGNPMASDMTGWYIEADKPVGVLSGNQCSGVGNTNGAADHLAEQLVPVEALAKTYIASPTNARPLNCTSCAPDLFRYVATEDNTVITTSPNVGGGTINKGEFLEITSGTPHVVSGSKPFYGYQFLVSQNSGIPTAAGTGDPSLMAMPVIDQFQYRYVYIIPSSFPSNFLSVTAPAGAKISLDGNIITPNWVPAGVVNGIMYNAATIPTTAGVHDISSDKKMGLVVSGFGTVASYGYMGGSGLQPINAGCISGGPYQALACNSTSVSIQLNGNPTCSDGSTPIIEWVSEEGNVVFSDNKIANPVATVPGPGIYTVTLKVTCDGNVTICATEIIVREPLEGCANVIPPTLVPPPAVIVPADNGQNYASGVNIGTAAYTATAPVTLINNASTQYALGDNIVTWTLTDGNGITTSGTQMATVVPPPTIIPPASITVDNTPGLTYATLSLPDTATYVSLYGANVLINDAPANGQYPIGTTIVTWTVTDGFGRTAKAEQLITVVHAPPTIVAPPAITVTGGYSGIASAVVLGNATYTTSVDPATLSNDALAQYPIGTATVNWTVTDGIGRTASATQLVTVVAPLPVMTPPADITVNNDNGVVYATGVVLGSPVLNAVGPYTLTNDAPAIFPIGTTTITWTLTDAYGNTVTTTQKVTVISAPPTIIAPAAVTVTADYSGTASGVVIGNATYTTSVDPATLSNDALAQYPIGTTTVNWTVTDGIGRTASATQLVTVVAPLPVMTPPADKTVTVTPGATTVVVNIGTPTFSAVGPYTLTNNAPAVFPIGVTTVTWTLKDAYGKTVTVTQKITVLSGACSFISTITSVPTSNVNTGGNPNRLYLGYGAQSTKLQANMPSGNASYSFNWTGTGLSSQTSAAPIFTATIEGSFTFTCTAKNNTTGCTSTSSIVICVTDARVLDNKGKWDGKKVYVCHLPPGNPANVQIISVSINAVDTHVPNHGGDGLGKSCSQTCNTYSRSSLPAVLPVFSVSVSPNPSEGFFMLQVKSDDQYTRVSVRIMDAFGRTVQVMDNVIIDKAIRFGDKFASGAYYAEVIQGEERKVIQMMKAK
jgi:hypothetical protein